MTIRGITVILVILWVTAAYGAVTPAGLASQGKFDEAVAAYRNAIDATQEDTGKARLHKELGELYVTKDDYQKAADEFVRALRLYKGFSEKERLQMAVYISWADRLADAASELRAILAEHPDNVAVRVHLARVLSWDGRNKEAIGEAEKVLQKEPDNPDALLVKANALRWSGGNRAAIPLYRRVLALGENFDARLGLSYALLAAGDKAGAEETAAPLQPKYPYQEKEHRKFLDQLAGTTRYGLDLRYNYYDDTDQNHLNRYTLASDFRLSGWNLGVAYSHIEARDPSRKESGDVVTAMGYGMVTDFLGIGAGVGLTAESDDRSRNLVTWLVKGDASVLAGRVGVSVADEALTDTAQILENGIRATVTTVYLEQEVIPRLFLSGSYSYRDFSDNNSSNGALFSARYAFHVSDPAFSAGYRFRYVNYARQSGGGYFDPNDYVAHQAFASFYYEKWGGYLNLSPYAGYQSFRRFGNSSDDVIYGVSGSLGYRFTRNILAEFNGEYGNFALQTAAGFEYHTLGGRISFTF
jgi:tetratricopeptide (TPR) repeat protein